MIETLPQGVGTCYTTAQPIMRTFYFCCHVFIEHWPLLSGSMECDRQLPQVFSVGAGGQNSPIPLKVGNVQPGITANGWTRKMFAKPPDELTNTLNRFAMLLNEFSTLLNSLTILLIFLHYWRSLLNYFMAPENLVDPWRHYFHYFSTRGLIES